MINQDIGHLIPGATKSKKRLKLVFDQDRLTEDKEHTDEAKLKEFMKFGVPDFYLLAFLGLYYHQNKYEIKLRRNKITDEGALLARNARLAFEESESHFGGIAKWKKSGHK